MGRSLRQLGQAGFSLVEVMVAALVLALGVLGVFTLLDGANATIGANNGRVGATNLARELVEYARATDYDGLTPSGAEAALRQRTRIAGTGAGAWQLERRGVTYTVQTRVCTFDDPKDGLSAAPPDNACPVAAALAGAPTETNPDDFRRVTFTLRWQGRGGSRTMTQTALVVNPAGGLGPRILTITQPAGQITGNAFAITATTDPAASLNWTVDDGASQGVLTGATTSTTSFAFTWNLGQHGIAPFVHDGTYTLQAQAFNARGAPGEARTVTLHVNRAVPVAPPAAEGGRNTQHGGADGVVDLRWQRNPERDVQGYVVRRSDGQVICPAAGEGAFTDRASCTDPDPPAPGTDVSYEITAVDCLDLATSCTYREGVPATVVVGPAGPAPDAPEDLEATVVDGLPTLRWDAPDGGDVLLYRIYRDTGTGLADRYDATFDDDPSYTDPVPGQTTAHRYWVTAVDRNFNESAPSAPVDAPPLP